MRAVVVYESMYGNTHHVADAIGTGLAEGFEVSVVPVARASQEMLDDADLVVVGGPTHAHGMSRESTRQSAAETVGQAGSELDMEPGAEGPGLRDWLGGLGKAQDQARAATFDTRLDAPAPFTGRASKGAAKALRRHGFNLVAEPESFLVTKENQLRPGEEDRARTWGARLAAIVAHPAG